MSTPFLRGGLGIFLYALISCLSHAENASAETGNSVQSSHAYFGAAIPAQALDDSRGGSFSTQSQVEIIGEVDGNNAEYVNTGDNIITSGSFENMTGIPVVVQNSGANVLIQNSVIVNMQMD